MAALPVAAPAAGVVLRSLARPAASGGARLVAELTGPVGTRIIGEAGYVGLANGNGELAMLVGRRWRGWLGPLLLDDLSIEAAARGVPNLEADVATANAPMPALLHQHGAVVIGHDRWTLERLLVPTAGDVPTWTGFGTVLVCSSRHPEQGPRPRTTC